MFMVIFWRKHTRKRRGCFQQLMLLEYKKCHPWLPSVRSYAKILRLSGQKTLATQPNFTTLQDTELS